VSPPTPTPMRVEKVLRLLPEVDVLAPLRSLLISTSRPHAAEEQHLTVGKRIVRSGRLSELIPQSIQRVSEHLSTLYYLAVDALDAEERGDTPAAVRAFLQASKVEARVGREPAARMWIEHALRIAEEERDRRPEIESLQELGRLEMTLGARDKAARLFQRSFALAEAEGDGARAAAACLALGNIALQRGTSQGAVSWFSRGLQHSDGNAAMTGRLHLGMSEVLVVRDALEEATARLKMAEQCLSSPEDGPGLVEFLGCMARLAARAGRQEDAIGHYRAALDHAQRGTHDPRVELPVRLELCRFLLTAGRLVDAEDEARRAEEEAVVNNLTNDLARLYIIMGGIRTSQRDDSGFVFFEKAIELSRSGEPAPLIEAEAYYEYGLFRRTFDDPYEARAYLERAREILETLGDTPALARVDAELERTPA
jgi:tetratricopeptide (TPR) repeat protein